MDIKPLNKDYCHRHELRKAIKILGSQTELALAINGYIDGTGISVPKISQQQISYWLNRDLKIRMPYTHIIEEVTLKQCKALDLMSTQQKIAYLREKKQQRQLEVIQTYPSSRYMA